MMKPILYMLLLLTGIYSCKKNEEEKKEQGGEIKLTVREYGSGSPIKNAAVGLLRRSSGGLMSPSGYEVVATANTDDNGFVTFGNYSSWENLYVDAQHPDYYDHYNVSMDELVKNNYLITLSGLSFVSVRFFNTYHKDKSGTLVSYGFDPVRGGGGINLISKSDTLYRTFYIPALHHTNVKYWLFENRGAWDNGQYYKDSAVPFLTAPTKDTVYVTVNY